MNWINNHPVTGEDIIRGDPAVKPVSYSSAANRLAGSSNESWISARVELYGFRREFFYRSIIWLRLIIARTTGRQRWLRIIRR